MEIAILITVHNRKDVTVQSLHSLFQSLEKSNNEFIVYLVDDGSTDGTDVIVSQLFPQVRIIKGTGDLYWGGGMNLAWMTALNDKQYDGFIWINDDSILYESAIEELLKPYLVLSYSVIVVGAFNSKLTGKVTYSGKVKETGDFVEPNGTYQEIKFMNGNLVFIPYEIVKKIGIIDSFFRHGIGDYDYGLRTIKAGFKLLLTSCYVGSCERHDHVMKKYLSKQYSVFDRIKYLYSPLNSPIAAFIYQNRYYGFFDALKMFLILHLYAIFPSIYVFKLKKQKASPKCQ